MSKKCPSGHDNPDSARFCRICGRPIIDQNSDWLDKLNRYASYALTFLRSKTNSLYESLKRQINSFKNMVHTASRGSNISTPEFFSTITLTPISVSKIRFINWFIITIFVLLTGIILVDESINLKYYAYHYIELPYEIASAAMYIVWGGLFLILLSIIYSVIRKFIFKINVSYIENSSFIDDCKRVAKNKRIGLFDTRKKKVRLWTRYEKIEKFDSGHLLVGRNGKIGIYSLKRRRIIIPIRYTRIEQFINSMTKACNGSRVDLYDINGNKLK